MSSRGLWETDQEERASATLLFLSGSAPLVAVVHHIPAAVCSHERRSLHSIELLRRRLQVVHEPESMTNDNFGPDGAERERLLWGLRLLGLREGSHRSVLHLWSRLLPAGMFDGHRSAMVAPDHLIYHGLTKRLVAATFAILPVSQRRRVGYSLREALAHSHFPVTAIYNVKRNAITSVGISEWAATIAVFGVVLRRTLPGARRAPSAPLTLLHRAMLVVDSFTRLVRAAYYDPREELDGRSACEARVSAPRLQEMAELFFDGVRVACLREDMSKFGFYLDVPNLHRLRELVDHVIPALLHVRHAQELLFENAHQTLKRAVVSGNGQDDAARAMSRYVQAELTARIRMQPAYFSIPHHWLEHAGIKECLARAGSLYSQGSGRWRCSGSVVPVSDVSEAAVEVAESRCGPDFTISWRTRATRGDVDRLRIGDAVRVLSCGGLHGTAVHVAAGGAARREDSRPAYFRVQYFFCTRAGRAAAVVSPVSCADGAPFWTVDQSRSLYLPLEHVRRALLLHDCDEQCDDVSPVLRHSASNRWQVLGRETGYPGRSG